MAWLGTPPLIQLQDWGDGRAPYPLSWEEQARLLNELPSHLQRMALFKVNTGTREQEVCGLRWEWEVVIPELGTSVFVIPGRNVKNREDRVVVLNRVARSVIDELRAESRDEEPPSPCPLPPQAGGEGNSKSTERGEGNSQLTPSDSCEEEEGESQGGEKGQSGYVFTYRGRRVTRMFNTAWMRARNAAGLPNVRVHDMKHTFGRRLRAAGVSLETRRVLLGHKSGDITTHYSAPEIEELIEAAERVCGKDSRVTPELTILRVRSGGVSR